MPNTSDNSAPAAGITNLRWLLLSAVIIAADQITKVLASVYLGMHQPLAIVPGLNLTLVHNTGVAFSFMSEAGAWARWFLVALATVVSMVIVIWLARLPAGSRVMPVALALILGGALGNVCDRIRFGYVVDFIDVYYGTWHWPAFNVADSAITVGAVLLIIDSLRPRRHQQST